MSKLRIRFWGGIFGLGALLLTVAGCTKRDDTPFGMQGDAEVSLSIGLDSAENEQTVGGSTKAAQPVLDPYKDFAVYVINTHQDTLARWASFDQVPAKLKFTPGAYKIVAEYKPAGVKIPAFDTYIYRAEEKFVIKAKDNLHIDLTAKLATAKVSVEFDPSFDFFYQSYSVDIRTVGVDSLRFAKGEARCGFFEPGSVRMRFNLKTQEGQVLTFSPTPLAKAKAADYYKLKLKVSSDQGSTQVIIIGTDDELNPDKTVTIEIPKYFLPKDKPAFTAIEGFADGVEQDVFEGAVPKWSVKANVPGGVSSFVIRLNDGATGVLGSKLGGQTVIDLASLPENDPLRSALKAAGFVWSEGLNSPEDASISTNVWLDFTDAMKANADGSEARYDFSIELKDNYDQVPETSHPCRVKAAIKAPTVKFADIAAGNIWSTRAFFTVQANYDLVGGTRPVLQYRKTSSQNWINAEEGTGGNAIVTALNGGAPDGNGFYSAQYELRGLQAATEYEFRVFANGREVVPSQAVWTTEQKLGIPGVSADGSFAGGWNETASTTGLGVVVQAPPTGWATRNALTTSQRNLSTNPNTGSGTEAWSEVSANNGTTLVPNPANLVRKAVQLRTTGWGQGSYSNNIVENPGEIYAAGPAGKGGSIAQGAAVRNTSAAILYLGAYGFDPASLVQETRTYVWYEKTGTFLGMDRVTKRTNYIPYERYNGGETINETGAAFASRPATLNFQYAFTPSADGSPKEFLVRAEVYAADGTKVGGVSWNSGTAVANMTSHTLKIDYTDLTKSAATLKLFFSSDVRWSDVGTPNGGPDYTKKTDGNLHIGNVLLIDNVTLGYDFK